MKAFLIFVVLAVVAVAVIGVTGVLDEKPELPAAKPVDPPADAVILPGEVGPFPIVHEVLADAGAAELYVGAWVGERGWIGTAMKSVRRGDVYRIAMEVHGSTVPGSVVVRATVDGFPGEIEPEAALTLRGQIASIEPSSDIMVYPHVIELNPATVVKFRNP